MMKEKGSEMVRAAANEAQASKPKFKIDCDPKAISLDVVTQLLEEIKKNEMKVKKIIEQNDFDISFVFDSYSFGGELLMRELKPNLKDDDNNIFPIGLFVAVSEKLNRVGPEIVPRVSTSRVAKIDVFVLFICLIVVVN